MNTTDIDTLRQLMLEAVEATQGTRREVEDVVRKLLVDKINELQERVDTLQKDAAQVRNKALEEAISIVNENRMNSNGATMTIDSLRGLLK